MNLSRPEHKNIESRHDVRLLKDMAFRDTFIASCKGISLYMCCAKQKRFQAIILKTNEKKIKIGSVQAITQTDATNLYLNLPIHNPSLQVAA